MIEFLNQKFVQKTQKLSFLNKFFDVKHRGFPCFFISIFIFRKVCVCRSVFIILVSETKRTKNPEKGGRKSFKDFLFFKENFI